MGIIFVRAKSCEDELRAFADRALKLEIGDDPSGPLS